jgi:hypothetical protein
VFNGIKFEKFGGGRRDTEAYNRGSSALRVDDTALQALR